MDEAKFQKAVEITRDYMQSLAPLMGGPTPRLYALFYWLIPFCESHFNRDVPSQKEYLRLLIYCSKEITAAWEGLNLIAQEMVRNGEHPPPELAKWTAEQRPRPTKRGPDPYGDASRNQIIVITIEHLLLESGMKATRNGLIDRIQRPEPCHEGGSACDAVGVAMGLSYKAVEKIWTNSASKKNPPYRMSKSNQ